MERLSCPICGDDSSVAKVSNLSGYASQDGSQLARLLAPPPQRTITGPVEFLALFIAITLIPIAWGFILWRPERFEAYTLVAINVGVFAAAVLIYFWGRSLERGYRQREADKHQQALARWANAYYCGKHDVAFLAGESRTVPSGQFAQLLQERLTGEAVGPPSRELL